MSELLDENGVIFESVQSIPFRTIMQSPGASKERPTVNGRDNILDDKVADHPRGGCSWGSCRGPNPRFRPQAQARRRGAQRTYFHDPSSRTFFH